MDTYVFAGFALMLGGLFLQLVYFIKILVTRDLKARYDLINNFEIKTLRLSGTLLIAALNVLCTFNFIVHAGTVAILQIMAVCMSSSFILIFLFHYFLKTYYPLFMEKRLKVLRYSPRISPKSGLPMTLLRESEIYLDQPNHNENLPLEDADVWIDEASGYVQVETYKAFRRELQCAACGHQTLFISKEEILKLPTPKAAGLLVTHYECRYCNHKENRKLRMGEFNSAQSSAFRVRASMDEFDESLKEST